MCAPSYDQSSTPPVPVFVCVCAGVCVRVQQMRKILISFWKFHSKKAKAATKVVCRRDADGCVYWGQWPGTHTQTHRLVYACMCVCAASYALFAISNLKAHTHRQRKGESRTHAQWQGRVIGPLALKGILICPNPFGLLLLLLLLLNNPVKCRQSPPCPSSPPCLCWEEKENKASRVNWPRPEREAIPSWDHWEGVAIIAHISRAYGKGECRNIRKEEARTHTHSGVSHTRDTKLYRYN